MNKGEIVVVRSNMAGVFIGKVKNISEKNRSVTLTNCINMYRQEGAINISDIAVFGISENRKMQGISNGYGNGNYSYN